MKDLYNLHHTYLIGICLYCLVDNDEFYNRHVTVLNNFVDLLIHGPICKKVQEIWEADNKDLSQRE